MVVEVIEFGRGGDGGKWIGAIGSMKSDEALAQPPVRSDMDKPSADSGAGKLARVIADEFGIGRGAASWPFVRFVLGLLPQGRFMRTRTMIVRAWGMKIGKGTTIAGTPVLAGEVDPRKTVTIGERCCINSPFHMDVNGPITIGDRVSIGHHVVIVTTDHEIGDSLARACGQIRKPVTIGAGAWIGARVTILPGATIGEGAIVSAGSVVSGNVPANAVVGGVPARFVRNLE